MEDETIEQRRQRNIQNNFLKLIELGLQPIVKEDDVSKKLKRNFAQAQGVDVFSDFLDTVETVKESYLTRYSQRVYQTRQLFGYIQSDIIRVPALLCEGPSGSGKSEVVLTIIQDLPLPCAVVKCTGFNSTPRLLNVVWFAIKTSVKSFCQSLLKNHNEINRKQFDSVLVQLSDDNVKLPTKLVQLVNQLKELFHALFDRIDECSSQQCFFHLVFDRLDDIAGCLEENTASKLLQLSSLCHPRIKVISLMRDSTLVRESDLAHYHLCFPPYTSEEIGSITRNRMKECIGSAVSAVSLEIKTHKSNRASSSSSSSNSGSKDAFIQQCCDTLLPKWDLLVKTATPFIGRLAFNVTSLWDFVLILWNNVYHISLDKIVQEIVQSKISSTDNEGSGSVVSGLLPSVSVKEIKSAVQNLMSQAYWEVSGGGSGGDAMKSTAVVAMNNNWAFLASNNPKESDVQKLTDEKTGRRKKARIGTDDAAMAVGGGAGGELGGSLKTGKGLQFRSISLERLVSVFLVVAGTAFKDGLTPRGYGNVEFYSMITSLVSMKYLSPLPSWSVKNPHYISHITHDMAVELSSRVDFKLAAYMVGSDTNCPL